MPPAGLEPAIPVTELPQTYSLDRTAAGIICVCVTIINEIIQLLHIHVTKLFLACNSLFGLTTQHYTEIFNSLCSNYRVI
jgi:hypothetical protein